MAIDKLIGTPQGSGNDVQHHVLRNIEINKKRNILHIIQSSYTAASNFNNGDSPSRNREYNIDFSDVPQEVLNLGISFLNGIEDNIILLVPEYEDGVRLNDDGTPIT